MKKLNWEFGNVIFILWLENCVGVSSFIPFCFSFALHIRNQDPDTAQSRESLEHWHYAIKDSVEF